MKKFEDHFFSMNMDKSTGLRNDFQELEGKEPFWKQGIFLIIQLKIEKKKNLYIFLALRLRITKSIKMSKILMKERKENREMIEMGVAQMTKTIEQLTTENNPLIEEKLKNMPYTKESVNMLRASLNKLRKYALTALYGDAWKVLAENKLAKNRISQYQKRINIPSPLLPVVSDMINF